MKNKILIWEQHYDLVEHIAIIESEDIEDYTKQFIDKYTKARVDTNSYAVASCEYVSHEINYENNIVTARLLITPRTFGASLIKEIIGFNFIYLDKMPRWIRNETTTTIK